MKKSQFRAHFQNKYFKIKYFTAAREAFPHSTFGGFTGPRVYFFLYYLFSFIYRHYYYGYFAAGQEVHKLCRAAVQ